LAKNRLISWLAFGACFFALGVIGLGAFTRLIDAGLGCPDWPGCYGHLTVPLTEKARQLANIEFSGSHLVTYKAWAEMIHRYFAGTLSILIISIIVCAVKKTYRTRGNIILACCLIALLAYQILLGQLTVSLKLLPIIVTQHLLGGFLILSTLWLIYLSNRQRQISYTRVGFLYPAAIIMLVLVLLQITLGAWTSTNYASLSCPDLPFCLNSQPLMTMHFKAAFNIFAPVGVNYDGGVLPVEVRQTIQMTHRLGALIITIYIFSFSALALHKLKHAPELVKSLYLILGVLCVQLCIGMANVIFKLPLASALSHNLFAVILLLSVITLVYKLKTAREEVSAK